MSDKTLNEIIKEEFVKLMSELDQNIISEQEIQPNWDPFDRVVADLGVDRRPRNAFGVVITPEMVAANRARQDR